MRYLLLFLLPTFAYAATFKDIVGEILEFNQLLVVVIFTLAFIVTIWKIVDTWIIHSGDPESIKKGKKTIIIAIIVLVIMSGLWGILELLTSSFFSAVSVNNSSISI
ncbi:hypothetical protein KTR10_02055 [Candidatus Kaiserbacteria bacterium]|nr:hypothetical protein [Candidatus Kaiserbacteria bacterium]